MPIVPMKMRFSLTVKYGTETVAFVYGIRDVRADEITVEELQEIPHLEAALAKLTGLRFHIEQES